MADDPRTTEGTAPPEASPTARDPDGDADTKLLLDREARVEAAGAGPFGRLGQRFDRRSPFWIGLVGGLGVGAAYVVGRTIVDARQILLLIFLALFIAVGLEPLVALLNRHRVRRGFAVLIVTLVALGAVGGLLAAAIPPLVNETTDFARLPPHYLQDLNDKSSF